MCVIDLFNTIAIQQYHILRKNTRKTFYMYLCDMQYQYSELIMQVVIHREFELSQTHANIIFILPITLLKATHNR